MKHKIIIFFLSLLLFEDYFSQSSEIKSSIQFPFQLKLKTLESMANQSIKDIIYLDSLHTDNDNDQLKCTVTKTGNIRITSLQNGKLRIDVPLHVWAEKGMGTLGVYAYQSTSFELEMSFVMAYQVLKDWRLATKTVQNGYQWKEKPSLKFAKLQLPITPIIENILNKKQQEFASTIDAQISQNINLKNDVIAVWNSLKTPQKVSEEYNTWMRMTPISIEATPFLQDQSSIYSRFKIDIVSESFVGTIPQKTPDVTSIPNLKYIPSISNQFEIYTHVTIPIEEATKIAKSKFVNQKFEFQEGKYNAMLTDIKMGISEKKMMIEAQMTGSFNGTVYLQGIPYYIDSQKIVKMRELDFDMKTRNLIFTTANWLFHGKIEKNLQDNFEMPIKESLDLAILSTNAALNQTKNGAKFIGKIHEMKPISIDLNDQNIILLLLSRGEMRVEF